MFRPVISPVMHHRDKWLSLISPRDAKRQKSWSLQSLLTWFGYSKINIWNLIITLDPCLPFSHFQILLTYSQGKFNWEPSRILKKNTNSKRHFNNPFPFCTQASMSLGRHETTFLGFSEDYEMLPCHTYRWKDAEFLKG